MQPGTAKQVGEMSSVRLRDPYVSRRPNPLQCSSHPEPEFLNAEAKNRTTPAGHAFCGQKIGGAPPKRPPLSSSEELIPDTHPLRVHCGRRPPPCIQRKLIGQFRYFSANRFERRMVVATLQCLCNPQRDLAHL